MRYKVGVITENDTREVVFEPADREAEEAGGVKKNTRLYVRGDLVANEVGHLIYVAHQNKKASKSKPKQRK